MRRYLTLLCAVLLPLLVVRCAEEAPPTALQETNSGASEGLLSSEYVVSPHVVLGGLSRYPRGDVAGKRPAPASSSGFSGPLFGLATAPNGDILVADAGAGLATRSGHTEVPLVGVTDISPIGRGTVWATRGGGADPQEDSGQALYRLAQGTNRMVANLFAFEEANDPDGPLNPLEGNVDSNPFDVQSLGGRAALVADAGGNDLLRVNNQGQVELLAVFPNEPVSTANVKELLGCPAGPPSICGLPPEMLAQAVPTSIAMGPDGYYYVGELKGFPAPTGASNIWRVAPDASGEVCPNPDCEKVFAGGFTSIIDMAYGPDGKLYVAELDASSWFAVEVLGGGTGGAISACDVGTSACEEVAAGIPILTAITFGKDGALWATTNALTDAPEVIEIDLFP